MKPKFILAAILLSGSCQLLAAPAPVSEAQGTNASSSSASLETRLAALENMIKSRNLQFLELHTQLESLQNEVSELRGVTEEQAHKLEKVLQRQRELYQEIEDRVSNVYSTANTAPVSAQTTPSTTTQISNNLNENDAYDRAVKMIMKDKRYDQAIPEFQAFLTNYPESVYIPNAHYWLGQLLTIKNQSKSAQTHFEAVVNQFPDSNKRADAMLKLATVYQGQGEADKAKKMLNDLIAQYPDATAAKLATEKLATF